MARRKKTREQARALQERHAADPLHDDPDASVAERYLLLFLSWVKANLKQILIGGGVGAVLASAVVIFLVYQDMQDQDSMLAFNKIVKERLARKGLSAAQVDLAEIENYASKHPDSRSQFRAALARTRFLVENEEYGEAAKNCARLADEIEHTDLKAYFAIQAAFLFEEAGQQEQSLAYYRTAGENSGDNESLTAHARYGEARMLAARGNWSEARKAVDELLNIKSERQDLNAIRKQALAFILTRGQAQ